MISGGVVSSGPPSGIRWPAQPASDTRAPRMVAINRAADGRSEVQNFISSIDFSTVLF